MEKLKLKTHKGMTQFRQTQQIRRLFLATMTQVSFQTQEHFQKKRATNETDFKNEGLRPFSDIKQEHTDENNDMENIDTNITSLIGTPNKKLQLPKNENNDSTPVNF